MEWVSLVLEGFFCLVLFCLRIAEQEAVIKVTEVTKQQKVENQALILEAFLNKWHRQEITWKHCVLMPRVIIVLFLINYLLTVSIRTVVHKSTVFFTWSMRSESQQKYLIPVMGLDQIAETTTLITKQTASLWSWRAVFILQPK